MRLAAALLLVVLVVSFALALPPSLPSTEAEREQVYAWGITEHLVVSGELYFIANLQRHHRPGRPANLYRVRLGETQLTPLLSTAEASALQGAKWMAYSPARARLAFLVPDESAAPANHVVIYEMASGELRLLPPNGRLNHRLAFSPDGESLAYYSSPREIDWQQWNGFPEGGADLLVLDLQTGEERQVAPSSQSVCGLCGPVWCAEGGTIAYVLKYPGDGYATPLRTVAVGSGETVIRSFGDSQMVKDIGWAANGGILCALTHPPFGIEMVNPSTGESRALCRDVIGPEGISVNPAGEIIRYVVGPHSGRRDAERFLTLDGELASPEPGEWVFGQWAQPAPAIALQQHAASELPSVAAPPPRRPPGPERRVARTEYLGTPEENNILGGWGVRDFAFMDGALYFLGSLSPGSRGDINFLVGSPDGGEATALLGSADAASIQLAHGMAHSRASGQLAFLVEEPTSPGLAINHVAVYDVAAGELRHLPSNGRQNALLTFSPQGDRLALLSAPASAEHMLHQGAPFGGVTLRMVDLATGEESELTPPSRNSQMVVPPVWSPTGDRIAVSLLFDEAGNGPVRIIDVATRETRTLLPDYPLHLRALFWPQPTILVCVGQDSVTWAARMDARTGDLARFAEIPLTASHFSMAQGGSLLHHWGPGQGDSTQGSHFLTLTGQTATPESGAFAFGRWVQRPPQAVDAP